MFRKVSNIDGLYVKKTLILKKILIFFFEQKCFNFVVFMQRKTFIDFDQDFQDFYCISAITSASQPYICPPASSNIFGKSKFLLVLNQVQFTGLEKKMVKNL